MGVKFPGCMRQKGAGTVAGARISRETIIEATEPVPFCDEDLRERVVCGDYPIRGGMAPL